MTEQTEHKFLLLEQWYLSLEAMLLSRALYRHSYLTEQSFSTLMCIYRSCSVCCFCTSSERTLHTKYFWSGGAEVSYYYASYQACLTFLDDFDATHDALISIDTSLGRQPEIMPESVPLLSLLLVCALRWAGAASASAYSSVPGTLSLRARGSKQSTSYAASNKFDSFKFDADTLLSLLRFVPMPMPAPMPSAKARTAAQIIPTFMRFEVMLIILLTDYC